MTALDMVTNLGQLALDPCESVQAKPAPTNPGVMSVVVPMAEESVYHQKTTTIEAALTKNSYHPLNQLLKAHRGLKVEMDTTLKWADKESGLHSSLEGIQSDHFAVHTARFVVLKKGKR